MKYLPGALGWSGCYVPGQNWLAIATMRAEPSTRLQLQPPFRCMASKADGYGRKPLGNVPMEPTSARVPQRFHTLRTRTLVPQVPVWQSTRS